MRHHIYHHFDEDAICRMVRPITQKLEKIMADVASILAKVTANTSVLQSVKIAADGLKEGQANIADQIAALKKQIADDVDPDFTQLDAAVDEQAALVAGVESAVGANLKPSGN